MRAPTVSAEDTRGKEKLVRYVLRPPVAQERLKLLPDELVRIELKRPFGDGTIAVDMDPLSLLSRLGVPAAARSERSALPRARPDSLLGPASAETAQSALSSALVIQ